MFNQEKVDFQVSLDIAEEQQINDLDNSQERFDVTVKGDLDDVTDYFDDSEDSTLYSGVVVELVGQWFHVDPIGASKWVQDQREQAKPEQLKLHLGG